MSALPVSDGSASTCHNAGIKTDLTLPTSKFSSFVTYLFEVCLDFFYSGNITVTCISLCVYVWFVIIRSIQLEKQHPRHVSFLGTGNIQTMSTSS